jgi:vacuolar-type H+-ATPase subunit F/Vma7
MREEIRVVVDKDGTVTFKVEGAQGAQCLSRTEALEREIGEVIERRKTGDYFKVGRVLLRNRLRQTSDDR